MNDLFQYIGGAAGCGKTWEAKEMMHQSPFETRLTATTGIAAINCSDDDFTCTTINSLLWYKDTDALEDAEVQGKLDMALRQLWSGGVTHIMIDEVSMMSGRQLDIIVNAIDRLNELHGYDPAIRLTILGDFCQLPPVAEKEEGFAFEAKCWDRFEDNKIIMTEIKRQADKEFINALRAVRRGAGPDAVDFFSPYIAQMVDVDFQGTTIFGYNREVDRFNKLRLDRLDTEWVRFPSHRFGKQLPEWKNIPQVFETKLDSLVMLLVNKSIKGSGGIFEYVNGDLGYIREAYKDRAVVELIRTGGYVEVAYTVKENVAKKEGKRYVSGTCEHVPLRVAYATTCHKSQGLTLDRVQVNINTKFFKEGGMTYVALSRARSPEGLRIVAGSERTFINRCRTSPKVERWL